MKPLCSLKVGQKVRTRINKGIFAKGYEVGWHEEIYEIVNVEMVSFHCALITWYKYLLSVRVYVFILSKTMMVIFSLRNITARN